MADRRPLTEADRQDPTALIRWLTGGEYSEDDVLDAYEVVLADLYLSGHDYETARQMASKMPDAQLRVRAQSVREKHASSVQGDVVALAAKRGDRG